LAAAGQGYACPSVAASFAGLTTAFGEQGSFLRKLRMPASRLVRVCLLHKRAAVKQSLMLAPMRCTTSAGCQAAEVRKPGAKLFAGVQQAVASIK
jgi:hypothetical protein